MILNTDLKRGEGGVINADIWLKKREGGLTNDCSIIKNVFKMANLYIFFKLI